MQKRPRILGIVNVTRDSFSDGGQFLDSQAAIAHARQLVADGADIIDLGAESTHPDSEDVSAAAEIARLTPVIEALKAEGVSISVDAYKPEVIRHVLGLGVDYINDITALRDPDAIRAVALPSAMAQVRAVAPVSDRCESDATEEEDFKNDRSETGATKISAIATGAKKLGATEPGATKIGATNGTDRGPVRLILMHSRSAAARAERAEADPATIVDEIIVFFEQRIADLTHAGIARERLILDPGMGFFLGSNPQASFAVLRELPRLAEHFDLPLLVSTSRKSFIGAAIAADERRTPRPPAERDAGTLATELWSALHGASYIRTHNARALRDGLTMLENIRHS